MKIFLTSHAGRVIDRIIPKLPKKPEELKALFITTAGNPYTDIHWIDEDRENLTKAGFALTDYDLVDKNEDEVRNVVDDSDVIFVEGGNTFFLLKYARESGFDKVMKEQKDNDKVFVGVSAGAYIATPSVEPTEWKREKNHYGITDLSGFNLVPFVVFAHYTDEYHDMIEMKRKELTYDLVTIRDDEVIEATENGAEKLGL
ncbi:MAG: Type 1 glutamine amidotransferase-like domain-containing protein [Patescibacteria group bacterium]|jgi:dipeptidase E